MIVILAALIFGLIMIGFTLLTLLPVVLVYLLVGVYMEGRTHPAVAKASLPAAEETRVPQVRAVVPAVQRA